MRSLPSGSSAAAAPLRAAIYDRAAAAARATAGEAERRAAEMIADAERQASAIADRAVEAGRTAAQADAAQRSARERRRAHELQLAARESLRRDLEARVLALAVELRTGQEYPRLMDALRGEVSTLLGPEATIEEHPDGGVVASLGARRVDLSLPSLARATLESMSGEVAELWTT